MLPLSNLLQGERRLRCSFFVISTIIVLNNFVTVYVSLSDKSFLLIPQEAFFACLCPAACRLFQIMHRYFVVTGRSTQIT
ncbi:hypothetical protein C8R43DRAFT_972888 [Mycena crocata]|nr:hypothetical protein C8R43DRAFT_972888 [Mycena crocata]